LPDTADFIDAPPAAAQEEGPGEAVFVRAIDLPTPSVRQARAAVAQQLDILSPLPPADVVFSVVLLGPAEAGQSRFAVGLAPRALVQRNAAPGERAVILTGRLDGDLVPFRFEAAGARAGVPDWRARLEIATVAGVCLAILLGAASLRLDREIGRLQARADAVGERSQRLSRETGALGRVTAAWRAAQATRRASVVDCALTHLAQANSGPVSLATLTLADGQVTARMTSPPSDAMVTALRALGVQVGAAAPQDPATTATAGLDIRVRAAACK
jgi:hypothetical protein